MTKTTTIDLAAVLESHAKWLRSKDGGSRAVLRDADLSGAVLRDADLSGADLRGADLSGADLRGAVLSGAVLSRADLSGAVLSGAVLSGAVLRGADLSDAVLRGADLRGADLRGADLSDATILDSGESWLVYRVETLPQLLLAGERGVEALAHWRNHDWADCPMAVAFSIHGESEAPALLRPRVRQFVQLFDAGLIPQPSEDDLSKWRK